MKDSLTRRYTKYVSQNIAGSLGISCYVIADTFFISKAAGADGITVLNLALPLYNVIYALGALIGVGSATRYGIDKARGEKNVNRFLSNAIIWEWLIAAPFMLAGIFFPKAMIALMGGDDTMRNLGCSYFRVFLIFAPLFMMQHTVTGFIRNDGGTVVAMVATISGSLFNILFDYILMFPCGLGLTGAALATAFSPVVCILVCLVHFFGRKNTIHLFPLWFSGKDLAHSVGLGVSGFVGEFASGVTTVIFNYLILGLTGNLGVAAYGIIANYAVVMTSVFTGISNGCQPLLSEAYGRGEQGQQRRLLKKGILTALTIAVVISILCNVIPDSLVSIFNSEGNNELARLASHGMRCYFPGYLFAGMNMVLVGFFAATEKVKSAMVTSLLRGVVAIAASAFLLSALFGMNGIWFAFALAEAFTGIVAWVLAARALKTVQNKSILN